MDKQISEILFLVTQVHGRVEVLTEEAKKLREDVRQIQINQEQCEARRLYRSLGFLGKILAATFALVTGAAAVVKLMGF